MNFKGKVLACLLVLGLLLPCASQAGNSGIGTEGGTLGNGILVQGDDGTDRKNINVDPTTGNLQVDVVSGAGGTQYAEDNAHVSGNSGTLALTVRADAAASLAGTDGDYSGLIVDANGKLWVIDAESASIKAALEIMDDWDESDRAKVNPIVGQAGVAAGSGVNGVTVQRVTIATDDEINDDLNTIATDTTNIDGKITACDTGAVVISSGAVTETNSAAIKTAVELLDNAIAGSEMQVDIVSGSSSNTEYTEADVDATITGIVGMWEDSGNTVRATSATYPLPIASPGTQYVYTATDPDTSDGHTFITASGAAWEVKHVALKVDASCDSDITVIYDSGTSASYDVTFDSYTTDSYTDYVFVFEPPFEMNSTSELKVTMGNDGGANAAFITITGRKF